MKQCKLPSPWSCSKDKNMHQGRHHMGGNSRLFHYDLPAQFILQQGSVEHSALQKLLSCVQPNTSLRPLRSTYYVDHQVVPGEQSSGCDHYGHAKHLSFGQWVSHFHRFTCLGFVWWVSVAGKELQGWLP